MLRINNIKMPVKHSENDLKKTVYKLYKINENEVKSFEIAGQAIDARKKDNVVFVYAVDISFNFDEETEKKRFENVKNVIILCIHKMLEVLYRIFLKIHLLL